jgi:hypothetical protein
MITASRKSVKKRMERLSAAGVIKFVKPRTVPGMPTPPKIIIHPRMFFTLSDQLAS